jgi:hypothetical protein
LAHKLWNDTMEWTSFIAETFFARAQSSEVFYLNSFYIISVHFK